MTASHVQVKFFQVALPEVCSVVNLANAIAINPGSLCCSLFSDSWILWFTPMIHTSLLQKILCLLSKLTKPSGCLKSVLQQNLYFQSFFLFHRLENTLHY